MKRIVVLIALLAPLAAMAVSCSAAPVDTPASSDGQTDAPSRSLPTAAVTAVKTYMGGTRFEIAAAAETDDSIAVLLDVDVGQTETLALVENRGGSWGVFETAHLLLPPVEDRGGGFSGFAEVSTPQGRFIGGYVDPQATMSRATDSQGDIVASDQPRAGAVLLFDDGSRASQIAAFEDDDLLSAVFAVHDVELDLLPTQRESEPDEDWNAAFVRLVLDDPSVARERVLADVGPSDFVKPLARLLAATPTVSAVDGNVLHLHGRERDAVLFLTAYVIDGERKALAYDYRPRAIP
jgi:hypothetical protein